MAVSDVATMTSTDRSDELEALAQRSGLPRVGLPVPLGRYLLALWRRRHFALVLAWSRFRARNTEDRLGAGWNILRPLLQAAIYATIFGILLRNTKVRPDNYAEFVAAGVFVFTFLSGTLTSGAKAIVKDLGLVRTLRFPRAVLPVSATLIQFYAFVPAIAVLTAILVVLGNPPRVEWLLLAPALVLTSVFGFGMAFLCARLTSIGRDFLQILPFVLRVLFYTSGVIADITRIGRPGTLANELLRVNPFHVYIELFRQSLLDSRPVDATYWAWGSGWAVLALLAGFLFFWRGERGYGR
jgi:teichoic acid transport system permease protein